MVGRLEPGTQTWRMKVAQIEEVEKLVKAHAADLQCTHAWIMYVYTSSKQVCLRSANKIVLGLILFLWPYQQLGFSIL